MIEGLFRKEVSFLNKRIIIVLLLLCVPNVFAKEGMVRKYKYYYLDRIDGPYDENVSLEYPNIDYDDFIYTDYIESTEKPLDKPNREIEQINYYKYKRVKNIKYIKIKNYFNTINISNLSLTYNGENIDYSITSTSGYANRIESGGFLMIEFDDEIDQCLIKLKIESDSVGNDVNIITSDDACAQSIYRCAMSGSFEWKGTNATYYSYSSWVEDIYPFKLSSGRIVMSQGSFAKYKFRDKLYRTYREDKIYSPDYLESDLKPFVIRDDENFIDEKIAQMEDVSISDDKLEDNSISLPQNVYKDELKQEIINVPNTSIGFMHKVLDKVIPEKFIK